MRSLLRKFAGSIGLAAYDTTSEQGRSSERYRRVAISAAASGVARATSLLSALVVVPLALGYLGAERYGLWVAATSLIAIFVFADLGLASGLVNAIAEAHGLQERQLARAYVSAAIYLLTGLALLVVAAFSVLYGLISWPEVFHVTGSAASAEAGPTVIAIAFCFVVSMPLAVIQRIQIGYQEGFASSLWSALGVILGLVGVVAGIALHVTLPVLAFAMAFGPVAANALNAVVLFGSKPWLAPNRHSLTSPAISKILRTGFLFLVLQVAVAVTYSSDYLVAAQYLGPESVAELSVTSRLFSLTPSLLLMVFTPLWPAYREAFVRGDVWWIRRTLRRSLLVGGAVTIPISLALILVGGRVTQLWVGDVIAPSLGLLIASAAWAIWLGFAGAIAMFLNGANAIRFLTVSAVLMTGSALVGKILLVPAVGLPGIVLANLIAQLLFVLVPSAVFVPRLLARTTPGASKAGIVSGR